jgi:hypothetical protein
MLWLFFFVCVGVVCAFIYFFVTIVRFVDVSSLYYYSNINLYFDFYFNFNINVYFDFHSYIFHHERFKLQSALTKHAKHTKPSSNLATCICKHILWSEHWFVMEKKKTCMHASHQNVQSISILLCMPHQNIWTTNIKLHTFTIIIINTHQTTIKPVTVSQLNVILMFLLKPHTQPMQVERTVEAIAKRTVEQTADQAVDAEAGSVPLDPAVTTTTITITKAMAMAMAIAMATTITT